MEHIPEQQFDSIIKLFVTWNNHESEEVGKRMADRFEKWFDCLTTTYMGENKTKKMVHNKICEQFSKQLLDVTQPKELIPFAYQILQTELAMHTENTKIFDSSPSPAEMVQKVWPKISQTSQLLLLQAYSTGKSVLTQPELYPLLSSRYELKQALFEEYYKDSGFDWVRSRSNPDRDLIPLTLFESGKLPPLEKQYFECWLINAPVICQDIQEFAPFAFALQQGCIAVDVKLSTEAIPSEVSEEFMNVSNPVLEPQVSRVPEQPLPSESDVNSIAKPIVLLVLTAIALFGVYVLLYGSSSQ